jgi:16S rRNA (adenine1518-N6/adenine1519-N6)-dimethyltransferase
VKARKRFGQHFLEPAWAAKVLQAIDPQPADVFLEIGPGTGVLTRPLAGRACRVVAVEIDRDLAASLVAGAPSNVVVVTGDFLDVDVAAIVAGDATGRQECASGAPPGSTLVRVAGNLPYNVSTPILFRLLDLHDRYRLFSDATVMLQREVADRLLAQPGSKEYGVLGILVGLRATVTPLLALPPGAFRPIPEVSSAVVRLAFHAPLVDTDIATFEWVIRGIFQQRRKTLLNCARSVWPAGARMSPAEGLAKAVLEPTRRPGTLDLTELARLVASYTAAGGPDVV